MIASAALTVAAAVLVVVGETAHPASDLGEWMVGCFAPGFVVSGWLLVRHRRAVTLGWLYLAAGLTTAIAGVAGA